MICGLGQLPEELKSKWIVTSPTKLITLKQSPAHYESAYILKEKEDTDSQKKGTLIHMGVLEYEEFTKKYTTIPNVKSYSNDELKEICEKLELKKSGTKDDLTKRIQEKDPEFKTFESESQVLLEQGKMVLSEKDWNMVHRIRNKVYARSTSGNFLQNAHKEVFGYCQLNDEVIMTFCVDAFAEHKGKGILCDLKTTNDSTKWKIERNHFLEGRHIQIASYAHCLNKITGLDFEEMSYFLFVESAAPYCVSEYLCDGGMIQAGHSERNYLVKKLVECHKKCQWPDPQPEIETTTLTSFDWGRVLSDEEHF